MIRVTTLSWYTTWEDGLKGRGKGGAKYWPPTVLSRAWLYGTVPMLRIDPEHLRNLCAQE